MDSTEAMMRWISTDPLRVRIGLTVVLGVAVAVARAIIARRIRRESAVLDDRQRRQLC